MVASVRKVSFVPQASEARHKIVSMDELADIVQQTKAAGKKVAHAHGTFDLLHLGHVKHLKAAHANADVLVVTLTADKYVNKGPNRPVFGQYLRAEMMAALETVDWVAINDSPDAVPAIRKIKPDLYVKGQDYINPEGDITGKITEERKAVEEVGGAIYFTEEVTFSSTELLNRNFNLYEPHLRGHLDELRTNGGHEALHAIIDKVKDYSVLLVGDAILDEYSYVLPMGKSAKENIIATRYKDEECFAGGIFAAANHVASFCKNVELVTILGARDSREDFIRDRLKSNVKMQALLRPDAPTTRKRRYIDPSYMRKMFEVYYMNDEPLTHNVEAELNRLVGKRIRDFDVVIVTDFGHGMIGKSTVDLMASNARFLAVNTQSNSANMGYNLITKYPRADYVCIDAPEARLAVTDKISPVEEIISKSLPQRVQCDKFVITHGQHGCVTHQRGDIVHTIPAVTKSVVDTVGAGDAFLAITAPLAASGASLNQIGFIGNVAGAVMVNIVGHRRSVEKVDVMKSLTALLK